jgi:hypothetical protein
MSLGRLPHRRGLLRQKNFKSVFPSREAEPRCLAKNSPHCGKSDKNLAQITNREFQDLATIKPLVSTAGGDEALRITPTPEMPGPR